MPRRNRRLLRYAREMRRDPTPAEEILWRELRRRNLGARFRRQEPIGPFIVDFVCKPRRLVIETDGDSHVSDERDRRRDAYLEGLGYRVVRFADSEVKEHTEESLQSIWDALHGEG